MCGIVGILNFNHAPVERSELERLNQSIYHRGPDEDGVFLDGPVGLAIRRLSIIDLSTGSQPMTSRDGRYTIVFNGEIYNYREVRQELVKLGHSFGTTSDTEVVLYGYAQWGEAVLSRLNGMWGLAIYDKTKQEVFLSRDRLGKKQLYYALNDHSLVFGSEMKIPMLHATENRRLRLASLPEFFTYGYIGGPHTALEGVNLLPDASWARVSLDGKMQVEPYWDITPYAYPHDKPRGEAAAAEEAYALLVDAVRLRLVADVPISVMLSSGLDSSACAYILAKELGAHLKTFSLGYGDSDFDESIDAGAFARKLDMPWQQGIINGTDVAAAFPRFIQHCDSLQSNTAQLVYYFVNQMIHADGFKVALNGSGGDELFAGYKTYQANTIFNLYRRLPAPLKIAANRAAQLLPTRTGRVSTDYMLKKFTECPYNSTLMGHAYWRTMFSQEALRDLLAPLVWEQVAAITRIYGAAYARINASPAAPINDLLAADLLAWLIPMLPWVDNMSMAHSVELRLPFLDYRLVERALSFPPAYLFNGWTLKKLMKRFLKNRLPDEVLYRSKRGTHLPISRWLNGELAGICDTYLDAGTLNREGLFNMAAVHRLLNEHRQRKADHTFKLWNLIIFSAWKEENGIWV